MMLPRRLVLAGLAAAALARRALAAPAIPDWTEIERAGHGGTVFFNAWGGDDRTNAFIAWAAERMTERAAITVRHVRLRDTADAVARVLAEKAAGREHDGSVDMIWINGPNFLQMKQAGLLYGPVLDRLPHADLVDTVDHPGSVVDFTVPVDGYAVPWRLAQIVYVYDSARVAAPPRGIPAMLDWARANPGRLTHPGVRNFLGVTFLKQALLELTSDPAVLGHPVDNARFGPATAPLWAWYDRLRPALWRAGKVFPESGPAQIALMNDGEIDLMISFNPSEAANAIATGTLPGTARAYVLDRGTIGNTSFVAIPANAANIPAAMLLADFLLSPEAQAHAADPAILGNPTVLALNRLAPPDRALFDRIPRLPGMLTQAELGHSLPEPHPSWMARLTEAWEARYTG